MIREKSNKDQTTFDIYPFFAMSHYQKDETQFFYSLNSAQLQNKYVETGYSIISKHLSPETKTG
jgi:type VI secretion system protein ImpG